MPDDPTEQAAPRRESSPKGKATLAYEKATAAEERARAAHEAATEADEAVGLARIDLLREFVSGGNFKIAAIAVVLVLLGPVVILGTWAIDGGVRLDGWGCYGTANFCESSKVEPATPE